MGSVGLMAKVWVGSFGLMAKVLCWLVWAGGHGLGWGSFGLMVEVWGWARSLSCWLRCWVGLGMAKYGL